MHACTHTHTHTHTPLSCNKLVIKYFRLLIYSLGGAADVCELMPGDEIVSINGALVANHYQDSVQLVISQAVKAGQIELSIRRSYDKGVIKSTCVCVCVCACMCTKLVLSKELSLNCS